MSARCLRRAGAWLLALLPLLVGALPPAWSEDAPAPRRVELRAEDGTRLAATFHASGAKAGPGVVLLPMYRTPRTAWDGALAALRTRGFSVLTVDLRGQGASAALGDAALARRVEAREAGVFAGMHQDAIAAVRWLGTKGGCDPKRIVLAGASVGGAVALDAAARHPTLVAGVAWLSPGPRYLGLDSLAHAKALPAATPVLLLAHGVDAKRARAVHAARPGARLVLYDDPRPADAGNERGWAHGTLMLGRLPLVESTLASFASVATGSKTEDVVLDGIVAERGPNADPWARGTKVGGTDEGGAVYAIRIGRRILFGGTAPARFRGLAFEVQTGDTEQKGEGVTTLGPPQIVGADLRTSKVLWSFGGMGSMMSIPGMDPSRFFGKTYPVLRAVMTDEGTTFEGEWTIPRFGGTSKFIRLCVVPLHAPPEGPSGGGVRSYGHLTVDLASR